jgi:hypothetical protein
LVGDTRYWPAAGRLDDDGSGGGVSRDSASAAGGGGDGGARSGPHPELVVLGPTPELERVVLGPKPELVALHCLSVQFGDGGDRGGGASATASGLPE